MVEQKMPQQVFESVSVVEHYMDQYLRLSLAERLQLEQEWTESKTESARERLFRSAIAWVVKRCLRSLPSHLQTQEDELVSHVMADVWERTRYFDAARGRYTTFITKVVSSSVQKFFDGSRYASLGIRMPSGALNVMNKCARLDSDWCNNPDNLPKLTAELDASMGKWKIKEVAIARFADFARRRVWCVDTPAPPKIEVEDYEGVATLQAGSTDLSAEIAFDQIPLQVSKLIAVCPTLNDKERLAIKLRLKGLTLDVMGTQLNGVTKERARQLVARATAKLKDFCLQPPSQHRKFVQAMQDNVETLENG